MAVNSGRPLDKGSIQKLATNALQSKSVTVERLDKYIYRTYSLRTAEGFFYLFRCRPSSNVKLLRHEDNWIHAEAKTLKKLSGKFDAPIPRLIAVQDAKPPTASSYLISGPFAGSVLADIEPSLSRHALASIDLSLGQYVRSLSTIPGPYFGFIEQSQATDAFSTWARAFAFMIETVMRDAEDVSMGLPCDGVRELVQRHRNALNRITQPRLTLLELAADRNVVVDRRSNRVSGVLDFSTAVWGDPFLSDCFYKPAASFAEGFGKLPNSTLDERVRQYLYVLYHSLLEIVRHFYRPSEGGDAKEAHRNLTAAMRQLSSLS